jgi:glycosyltransferase 2 family protein
VTSAAARRAGRALACAGALALVFLFLRRMPVAAIGAALRSAEPAWFGLALAVNLTANTAARVQRWAALLRPVVRSGPEAGGLELAKILFASQATSNLLPARAGEAVRVVELRRRGYAVPGLLAAQMLEKVVEAASLCILSGLAAAAVGMPPVFRVPVWSVALIGVGLLASVALLRLLPRRRSEPSGRVGAFLARLSDGIDGVGSPAVWPRSLLWSCASDLCDAAVLGLCLQAASVHLGLAAWLVTLLAINLAILLPSTPGHLGVMEAAAGTALIALGVPPERALAGAVLYHAIQILPSTALGLAVLRKRWIRQRSAA